MSRFPTSVLKMNMERAAQLSRMIQSSSRFHLHRKYAPLCAFILLPCQGCQEGEREGVEVEGK